MCVCVYIYIYIYICILRYLSPASVAHFFCNKTNIFTTCNFAHLILRYLRKSVTLYIYFLFQGLCFYRIIKGDIPDCDALVNGDLFQNKGIIVFFLSSFW